MSLGVSLLRNPRENFEARTPPHPTLPNSGVEVGDTASGSSRLPRAQGRARVSPAVPVLGGLCLVFCLVHCSISASPSTAALF